MDYSILVNKDHLLEENYVPETLVEIHEPTGEKIDKSYINRLDEVAYKKFKSMQQAALEEGHEIFIDSSFRSYEYQKQVLEYNIEKNGLEHATKYVAPAGGSEHQTGLAIDVIYRRNGEMIEDCDENAPEIQWLFDHSYEYGYILRYPKGKEDITGYNYEPWHFRYVGEDIANIIHKENLTLEEYKLKYDKKHSISK